MKYEDGETILFDLVEDPWEDANVAGTHPDEVRRLSACLSDAGAF